LNIATYSSNDLPHGTTDFRIKVMPDYVLGAGD
jgi:hypothetical protein